VEKSSCKQPGCHAGQTGICCLGESNPSTCKEFKGEKEKERSEPTNNLHEESMFIQWSGEALGLDDLAPLAMQRSLSLIAVIGAEDSGKTTALASLYMILRNGILPDGYSFSGSYTLSGWERLAYFLTLKGDNEFEFPPHTPSNEARTPGLLHLSFSDKQNRRKELVFTDAPGEWFSEWAINEQSPKAAGARWINQNADFFLLFIDCQKLFGSEKGIARREMISIAQRIRNNATSRPVGVVWAKADIQVNEQLRSEIQNQVDKLYSNPPSFNVSVQESELWKEFSEILQWLLDTDNTQKIQSPYIEVLDTQDFFFAIR
jgi:hypothetical protein